MLGIWTSNPSKFGGTLAETHIKYSYREKRGNQEILHKIIFQVSKGWVDSLSNRKSMHIPRPQGQRVGSIRIAVNSFARLDDGLGRRVWKKYHGKDRMDRQAMTRSRRARCAIESRFLSILWLMNNHWQVLVRERPDLCTGIRTL